MKRRWCGREGIWALSHWSADWIGFMPYLLITLPAGDLQADKHFNATYLHSRTFLANRAKCLYRNFSVSNKLISRLCFTLVQRTKSLNKTFHCLNTNIDITKCVPVFSFIIENTSFRIWVESWEYEFYHKLLYSGIFLIIQCLN